MKLSKTHPCTNHPIFKCSKCVPPTNVYYPINFVETPKCSKSLRTLECRFGLGLWAINVAVSILKVGTMVCIPDFYCLSNVIYRYLRIFATLKYLWLVMTSNGFALTVCLVCYSPSLHWPGNQVCGHLSSPLIVLPLGPLPRELDIPFEPIAETIGTLYAFVQLSD